MNELLDEATRRDLEAFRARRVAQDARYRLLQRRVARRTWRHWLIGRLIVLSVFVFWAAIICLLVYFNGAA